MGVVRHPTKHLRVEVTNWCQCHSASLSNHTIWENIPGSLSVSRHTKCGHVRELIITGSDIPFCRFSQLKVCEKTSYILSTQIGKRIVQRLFTCQRIKHCRGKVRIGEVIALEPALAKYTRRGLDLDTYWFVQYGMTTQPYQFTKGSIFHLMEPDINQEIYGLPGYLSAIPSALLNESATLFRRKYYINGSHAGFIMYMTDAAQNQEDVNNLRNAMKSAKGPGNFRNLFMYSPNGKKDGLQIIPLSEVAAKDEFLNIKNVSRDDMMAAHRVPPQMMGIIPNNVGGFGDVEKASKVFMRNELIPLQNRIEELNKWLKDDIIKFMPYSFI